jgi:hypothetical protein
MQICWSLSNLFSESKIPYLYYRNAERIFCRAFNANDLSRSDVSADASKNWIWIWLKTFLIGNNKTLQKVAEFNADRNTYINLKPFDLVKKVSELRNARINFTQNAFSLSSSIYHCVLRDQWIFKIFEEGMDLIDIEKISNVIKKKNTIAFNDWKNEYGFSLSKSTLSKRFITDIVIDEFEVELIEDPLEALLSLKEIWWVPRTGAKIYQTIYLPLYWSWKHVYEKSWLNQRNALWRKRHSDEVYIPIPKKIHHNFPWFFPSRDTPFDLILPNWKIMKSKICQDWWKALMSQSNKELGKRILREVLWLEKYSLLTYEKLQEIWIDSVRLDKMSNWMFEINFWWIWSYEEFENTFEI